MKSIVEISLDHSYHGMYLTPDMWFYGSSVLKGALHPVVQEVIHAQQPLASHYAAFANVIYEFFAGDEVIQKALIYRTMMTMSSISMGYPCLARTAWSLTEVAASVYFRTTGVKETSEVPLLIPKELADLRIERPWRVSHAVFQRIIRAEPWQSWTERLRAELRRNARVLRDPHALPLLDSFWENYGADAEDPPTPQKIRQDKRTARSIQSAARRSISRAVKLHDRFNEGAALRRFVAGEAVTISGVAYDYLVQKSHSLIEGTIVRDNEIVPLSLTIQNKQGEALAGGCLVFKDVGVLDFVFHVRIMAGNAETEQKMLQAMHLTSVTERFFADPLHVIKGITDRYTAPLHTANTILTYSQESSHYEDRMTLYDIWHKMAMQTLLQAIQVDESYFYQMLSECNGRDTYDRQDFTKGLEVAVTWFDRARVA